MNRSVASRFWGKVDFGAQGGCWDWTASRNQKGYGLFFVGRGMRAAHRVSWELLVGDVPDGMALDHLVCANKACVNPSHLDLCTPLENTQRYFRGRTHCKRGHELTPENLMRCNGGRHQRCRACFLLPHDAEKAPSARVR